jgi:hypothetical protein
MEYLASYSPRNRSETFADYATQHLLASLGSRMLVDIDAKPSRCAKIRV